MKAKPITQGWTRIGKDGKRLTEADAARLFEAKFGFAPEMTRVDPAGVYAGPIPEDDND